ncbi:MAG: aminotransferase class IV [Rhodoglobus sp.]
MSVTSIFRWQEGQLVPIEPDDVPEADVIVADSWLVADGHTLAISLHRERFLRVACDAEQWWDTAIAAIPHQGLWFPRIEQRSNGQQIFHLRPSPKRSRSVVLAQWDGPDPRSQPSIKGPDLESLLRVRSAVRTLGADEAVILSGTGQIIEGAYSGLLWWRGDTLCGPPQGLARIDSVTTRSVLTLAAALGVATRHEAVSPQELEGTELWVLNALHGIRIATQWINGPALAELPGRLTTWRARLDMLRTTI